MNILNIGTDRSAFTPGSATQKRFREYSVFKGINFWFLIPFEDNREIKLADNVIIKGVACRKKLIGWFKLKNSALDLARDKKINIVTVQDPFFLSMLAIFLKKKIGARVNIQIHGDYFSNKFWKLERLFNRLLLRIGLSNLWKADSIRVVSGRIMKDLVKRGLDKDKIINVPIFVPWQFLSEQQPNFILKEKYSQFDFIALFLARLEKVKNAELLLRAWKEFLKNNPKAGLVIVGGGSEEARLKKLANDLYLNSNVAFEPATRDVVSYYRGADCFVLASNYEGWGRAVIEAMACECPVIMTDVGCAGEAVKDGESGMVFPVGDKAALLEALAKIKNDSGLRERLAAGALESLKSLPDKEETFELYLESWKKARKN